MKQVLRLSLFISILALFCFSNSQAQSLKLITSAHDTVSGELNTDILSTAMMKNISKDTINVALKMVEVDRCPGHLISFCWDQCIGPDTTQKERYSLGIRKFAPGQMSDFGWFEATLFASDIPGISTMKFVFFVKENPADYIEYYATFKNGITSAVNDNNAYTGLSGIYPNPVSNDNAVIKYNVHTNQSAELNVFSITGNLMKNYRLDAGSNSQSLEMNGLPQGSYFYILVVDGVIRETKHFIVVR